MTQAAMSPLTELQLLDPDGEPTSLGAHTGDILVLQLVRYFGCLPCQQWLIELDRATAQLAPLGARPVAVGGSADYQARWLRDERGVRMPLLLDPDQRLRDALQVGHLGGRLLDPRGLASYGRAMRAGLRPQRITRDTVQAPGVVILDAQLEVRWRHVGKRIGDYPRLSEVIDAVRTLAAGSIGRLDRVPEA
ncbi:MAG: redoxin domain-containing protein [Pseudonocardiales bacterium]